ncbi:hypothetical protein OBBRIDRAFT_793106 [Obba rivulosa]|uniref:Uncharacterized protein n=1 Tax=Obba rivulosa TaxID=1052685 RepID=A0A8E2DJQ9_9APHY|nr:hypothetical protein OBBRIDRAFT_793106 [Obba rivulosa]
MRCGPCGVVLCTSGAEAGVRCSKPEVVPRGIPLRWFQAGAESVDIKFWAASAAPAGLKPGASRGHKWLGESKHDESEEVVSSFGAAAGLCSPIRS